VTRIVVGVIGHVDHGKTALVRALTGQDTDRLPEEKRRGISIALGFAHLAAGPDGEIDLIDMPGHERFVRTMISGATGIDAVLLVVAANEGIKPQTVEHVDIASLLGLRRAVIAITKTDLVSRDQARRISEEAMCLLVKSGLDSMPPVMTSTLREEGLAELRQQLAALTAGQAPHPTDGLAYLPIDRAFSVTGHGPVVTGTLRGAAVRTEETLELLPSRRRVRIRAIQVHGARVAAALPGQRAALNLRDVELEELERGMAVAAADAFASSEWLTIAIRAVAGAPPLRNGIRVRALIGTSELAARLRLLDSDILHAGESAMAQLHCAQPVAVPAREPVILRLPSPARTVAGGKVLEAVTCRQRRHDPQTLQRLACLRDLSPAALIAAELWRRGADGISLRQASQLTALALPAIAELIRTQPIAITRSGWLVRQSDLKDLVARIPALVAPQEGGLSRKRLSAALPETGPEILEEALAHLLARGALQERGDRISIPRPTEDRLRAQRESELASRIAESLRQAGLSPPNPGEIVTDARSHRAVDQLLRAGILVRAVDRAKEREMLFHRDAIEEAQRRLVPLLERAGGALVTEMREALGISRRHIMPLLEHLDTIRFTRRIRDRRVRGGLSDRTDKGSPKNEATQEHL
jgi:selenocysteine-specific elongation factor